MLLNKLQLNHLHQTAINAATKAGTYIAEHRPTSVVHKSAGSSVASQVVTEVDSNSQAIILAELQSSIETYDLGLLAEEQEDDGSRLTKDYFWCIDPLDGTLPFIEDRAGYAVAIALISQAGIPQIGVVYNPVDQSCYSAIIDEGAWLNGKVMDRPSYHDIGTLLHHRSLKNSPEYKRIIKEKEQLFATSTMRIISHGGAVMNAIWTIEKAPAYYFAVPKPTQGGGCIWDYAATVCIFNTLGLKVTDYFGKPLHLNRPESIYMNAFGVVFSTI